MREIKVRAWNKDLKEMILNPIIHKNRVYITSYGEFVGYKTYPLMQYTGLKDRNGTEIYEGDIVNIEDIIIYPGMEQDFYYEGIVKYSENDCMFYVNGVNLPIRVFEHGCVIGNIYENPELEEFFPVNHESS